jgi:hypothetical protein
LGGSVLCRGAVAGDSPAETVWQGAAGVTPELKALADSFLVSRLGRECYRRVVVFDPARTDSIARLGWGRAIGHREVYYEIVPFAGEPFRAVIYVTCSDVFGVWGSCGVPDCTAQPGECEFIDRQTAFSIAAAAGLPAGLSEWSACLLWEPDADGAYTYQWEVGSLIGRQRHGGVWDIIRLDANDGRFIRGFTSGRGEWVQGAGEGDAPN